MLPRASARSTTSSRSMLATTSSGVIGRHTSHPADRPAQPDPSSRVVFERGTRGTDVQIARLLLAGPRCGCRFIDTLRRDDRRMPMRLRNGGYSQDDGGGDRPMSDLPITLQQLQLLIEVAESGSFTSAAERSAYS